MKESLDFIVIGAQKSGTTTLFEYLRLHPDLYLPPGKEAPFFSNDSVWAAGWSEYVRRYFGGAEETRLWGTITPQYMVGSLYECADPDRLAEIDHPESLVPERIAAHSPNARLVAILRDPVERAFSHYRMERFRETDLRPFETAVEELLEPDTLQRSRRQPTETSCYITNGEYGRILEPYFELFGRQRVFVCFTTELAADPAATLAAVMRFLGVSGDFQPPNLGQRYRVAGSRRRIRRLDLNRFQDRVARNRVVRSTWRALPSGVRGRIDRDFKELKYQADIRNRVVEPDEQMGIDDLTRRRLTSHYAADRELLRKLIDREPSW